MRVGVRYRNPQFPGVPPIPGPGPIRPGNGPGEATPIPDSARAAIGKQGIPVSRFGRERESGSRLAANREVQVEIGPGDSTPPSLCEYSMHDPGLPVDVVFDDNRDKARRDAINSFESICQWTT